MHVYESLVLLNIYLKKNSLKRSFIICGGASLILQGIISRTTRDIDIVAPPLDDELKAAAISVADKLGLDIHWLNDGPGSIVKDLSDGWRNRTVEIFKDSNLTVYSISREDLIFSKLWAFCDRQKDKQDLLSLHPSLEELEKAQDQVKEKDENPLWPTWVAKQVEILIKELEYDK